jgi:hypothetical protein
VHFDNALRYGKPQTSAALLACNRIVGRPFSRPSMPLFIAVGLLFFATRLRLQLIREACFLKGDVFSMALQAARVAASNEHLID